MTGVDNLLNRLVAATNGRSGVEGTATVALTPGSGADVVLSIDGGRVTGPGDAGDVEVTLPLSAAQLDRLLGGEEPLTPEFIRGDLKPVGATGALVRILELLDDVEVRRRLTGATR
ncbi:MAG: hypothetical protein ACK5RL_21255 [Acidimicrobiales bacterium]